MTEAAAQERGSAGEQIRRMVERTIQRNIKGLEYFASPAPPVGLSEKDVIHRRGTLSLYHYKPLAEEIYRVPILMVMATTNRGYVFDIAEDHSFVRFLLNAGLRRFRDGLERAAARREGAHARRLSQRFIADCIRRVQERTGEEEVTLAGYCMGGVLATIFAATHPEAPIRNLVCFTTPVDFRQMELFAHMADPDHFDVDRLIDTVGNMPPEMLLASFDMLRPSGRIASQRMLWDNMWNSEFVGFHRKMERWSNDMLPAGRRIFPRDDEKTALGQPAL